MTSASISKAEKSYIQAGLLTSPPRRADGRSLHDFRAIYLETGVAPLSNGSARLSIGRNPLDGSGGTEVLAAVKLEVENIEEQILDGGRIACNVSCSPSAYPHLSSGALDDLQHDLTTVLHQTLSHPSLHPKNLGILPRKKSWLLNLDLLVTAEAGNIYDALFLAARAALWDTKVPRTRSVEYKTPKTFLSASGDMDVDQDTRSGFDTRHVAHATDFELPDYWDEGEILEGRERWPVAVTLNLLHTVHFLDATLQEEASCASRLLVVYSHESPSAYTIQSMRMSGSDELSIPHLKKLIKPKASRGPWPLRLQPSSKMKTFAAIKKLERNLEGENKSVSLITVLVFHLFSRRLERSFDCNNFHVVYKDCLYRLRSKLQKGIQVKHAGNKTERLQG